MTALVLTTHSLAQSEDDAAGQFEEKVAKFEKFFATKPKMLVAQRYPDSPIKEIFYYERFEPGGLVFDVRKTDSLITPYTAYITLSSFNWSNYSAPLGEGQ